MKTFKALKPLFAAATFALATQLTTQLAPHTAHAADQYTFGHGDIGVGYEGGQLEPHWHIGSGSIINGSILTEEEEYAPGGIVAIVPGAPQPRPSSATFDSLGVAAGEPIWILPKSGASAAGKPNLGIAAEELEPGDWLNESITLSLVGWSGPGEFALFDANSGMSTIVDLLFSTAHPEATLALNSYDLFVGGHEHFNWAFTAPGYYELTFEFSGTHLQDGLKSASETFAFHVIPEPSAVLFLVLVGGATLLWRARFRSSALLPASLER